MRRMGWGLWGGWGWGGDGGDGLGYLRGGCWVGLHIGVRVERGMASTGGYTRWFGM